VAMRSTRERPATGGDDVGGRSRARASRELSELASGPAGTTLGALVMAALLAMGLGMVQPGRAIIELVAGVAGPTWALGRAMGTRSAVAHRHAVAFLATFLYWTIAVLVALWLGLPLGTGLVAVIALLGIAIPVAIALLGPEVGRGPRVASGSDAVEGTALAVAFAATGLEPDAAAPSPPPGRDPGLRPDHPSPSSSAIRQVVPWALLQVGALVVGGALVAMANMWADRGIGGDAAFVLFWFGMAGMLVPVAYCVVRDRARWTGLVALGLLVYWPRFVRAPSTPSEHDEIGHWLQAQNIWRTGRLFLHTPIVPEARNFPGLHVLTVGLQELTGMSTWRTGTFLIAAFHVLTLFGIYRLGVVVSGRDSGGAVAALVYAVTPEFSYFDSLYAYESYAVPLFVWSLAALATALKSDGSRRRSWLVLAAACLATSCVTHHVTSYELIACIAVVGAACVVVPSNRDLPLAAACGAMALGGAVFAFVWQAVLHAGIVHYLVVYPQSALVTGFDVLLGRHPVSHATVLGGGAALGRRTLFAGNPVPGFEIVLAFAEPIGFTVLAVGTWLASRRRVDPLWILSALLAASYILLLPFALTVAGEAIPHRSSATTLVGVALLAGVGLPRLGAATTRALRRRWAAGDATSGQVWALAAAALALLCGSYGIGVNVDSMFGGHFVLLSDDRSVTQENIGVARWILDHDGPGRVVLADSRDEVVLEAWGRARPGPSRLAWETFFPAQGPPPAVARADVRAHVRFIVVDDRMATQIPPQGYYFSSGYEPAVPQPLPSASLTKFKDDSWLRLVHRTEHYAVYQVLLPPRR
jgi:hypothetical protein